MINTNQQLTLEKLSKVKFKRPKNAGKYWQGIPHYDLIWNILNHIDTLNYTILDKQWIVDEGRICLALNKDKSDMVACLEISISSIQLPNGIIPSLGIINSNSMRSSLKTYVGLVVKPANNGIVIASPFLKVKHTIHLDLENLTEAIISTFHQKLKRAPEFIESLKTKELLTDEINRILIEVGTKNIMPWSRIGQVIDNSGKWTAWKLLNAFSNITKQSPSFNQLEMLNRFRKLLQKY